MGGFGGGGQQASPPTLNVGQSAELFQRQLELQRQFLPSMARAAGGASRSEYRRNIDFGLGLLGDAGLRQRYEAAMPEETQRRRALLDQLDASQAASPEYQRMQEVLADTSGGALGQALTREAKTRAANIGGLTPEEERQATQQARAAMAARGMATGNAAMGAELLNRSQFQRARRAEDLNLISGVGEANQARALGFSTQAAQAAEQERARRLGLRQDAYNFAIGTNPGMMAIGMGSPYANMTQPAMSMVAGARGLEPMYSGGSFSSGGIGGGLMGGGMGALSGALSGAALGSVVPGIGTALGAGIGALAGGATGFMGGMR